MSEVKVLLQCYNKGCLKKYDLDENCADCCCHHPGEPVFHDAYKGWSCCKKKCTDFTEFLNIKGCTLSFHNNVKPPELEKAKPSKCDTDVVVINTPIQNKPQVCERPDENSPTLRLPCTVSPSLEQALLRKSTQVMTIECDETVVEKGTACKNPGCRKSYEGEDSNFETCIYHDGVPIFHEGLKYWTCCLRKTTDFDSFLDQVGCKTGEHLWFKKAERGEKVNCRIDWYQTDSHVYVSIFAKGCDPDKSFVEANPIKLQISLHFNGDLFNEEIILGGVVDLSQSGVNLAATKVEIKLKKADAYVWKQLYNSITKVEKAA